MLHSDHPLGHIAAYGLVVFPIFFRYRCRRLWQVWVKEALDHPSDPRTMRPDRCAGLDSWVGKQLGFTDSEQSTAKKRIKREKFRAGMMAVVP